MMKCSIKTTLIVFGLGGILLAGCEGGGGGSSTPSVTYTGLTTRAAITSSNADDLATTTLETGSNKGLDTLVTANSVSAPAAGKGLSLPGVASLLNGMSGLPQQLGSATTAKATSSESIAGACGGSATISGTNNGDSTNFNITGSISYSNYCTPTDEGNVVVNGSANVTLVGSTATGLYEFGISTSYLTIATAGQSVAFNLNFSSSYDGTDFTTTITANYQGSDGEIYRVENYQIIINDDGANYPMEIAGKVFHPDYGYVTVTTTTPIIYSLCSGEYVPTIGAIRLDGANGGYITIDANTGDCATYTLSWSEDGGSVSSAVGYW